MYPYSSIRAALAASTSPMSSSCLSMRVLTIQHTYARAHGQSRRLDVCTASQQLWRTQQHLDPLTKADTVRTRTHAHTHATTRAARWGRLLPRTIRMLHGKGRPGQIPAEGIASVCECLRVGPLCLPAEQCYLHHAHKCGGRAKRCLVPTPCVHGGFGGHVSDDVPIQQVC